MCSQILSDGLRRLVDPRTSDPQNGNSQALAGRRSSGPGEMPAEPNSEVAMPAYLLLFAAVLSRIVPHPGWLNFTAVGAALLYFGARRRWREMLAPLAALIATDYFLTVYSYHFAFTWKDYIPTWSWYIAAMFLGSILLSARTTLPRFAAAVVLGPTSFFLISNFAVWVELTQYPKTLVGLSAAYIAGIPFYRNDLLSTTLIAGAVFGVPVLVRRLSKNAGAAPIGASQ